MHEQRMEKVPQTLKCIKDRVVFPSYSFIFLQGARTCYNCSDLRLLILLEMARYLSAFPTFLTPCTLILQASSCHKSKETYRPHKRAYAVNINDWKPVNQHEAGAENRFLVVLRWMNVAGILLLCEYPEKLLVPTCMISLHCVTTMSFGSNSQ